MARLTTLLPLVLASCGGGADPPPQPGPRTPVFPLSPPTEYSRDILRVEGAARSIHASLERSLLRGLARGDWEQVAGALGPGFRGLLPPSEGSRAWGDGALVGLSLVPGEAVPELSAGEFVARLRTWLDPVGPVERADLELTRLHLDPGGDRALARIELAVFGHGPADGGETAPGRVLLRIAGRAECERGATGWHLAAFETGGGRLLASDRPRFVERTRASGLVVDVDGEMAELMQDFVDRHVTLALGGLSVIDWNDDGFPDVIQTSRGQTARLFLNDGRGGFLPGELPFGSSRDSGSFVLVIDLDGDGVDELVTSCILSYGSEGASEGGRAQARLGVYTREGAAWRALEDIVLPVPRGVRRVAIQSIVPLDADGDGRLDLFLGVYGDMNSRGKDYNTVEAHDGGDNHLLMNRGGLRFEEVSEDVGIRGTQYTYVAEAFDFDGDGDTDLFEGNDFGPNILWENDGRGFFRAQVDSPFAGESAYTMGVTLGDPHNSGAWHMYISNMSAAAGTRIALLADEPGATEAEPRIGDIRRRLETIASGNMLYAQDPGSGRWSRVGADAGCADAGWAWGCVFWDPDNDGDLDLFVTNGFTSHSRRDLGDWNSLYWRQVSADAGFLARGERTRDVNSRMPFEGSFSGYQRDRCYQNVKGVPGADRAFAEAAWLMGLDTDHDGRCAAPADVDGDGDQDLLLWTLKGLRLFENRGPVRSFARLRLLSASPVLGSVVSVSWAGGTSRSIARVLDGFQTQRPADMHFGLGDARTIDRVEVRWPSGEVQLWRDLPVGKRLTLVRGDPVARADTLPIWPRGSWNGQAPSALPTGWDPGPGPGALFVRFGPVEPELSSLPSRHGGVAWLCARTEAGAELPDGWSAVGESDLAQGRPAGALPHAAIYDRDGKLRRSFAWPPAAEDVSRLLMEMGRRDLYPDVLVQAGRLALRDHRHRQAIDLFRRALAVDPSSPFGHEGLARGLAFLGLADEAEAAYGAAVAADPDYALGHHNLGVLQARRGRPGEAVLSLERALEIGGESLPTLLALGEARAVDGDGAGALMAFERALTAHPRSGEAHMLAGKVLAGRGQHARARQRLEEALVLDPDLSEARRALLALDRIEELTEEAAAGEGGAGDG